MHSIKTKSYQNLFAFDRRNESCFYSIYIDDKQSIEICENEIVNYVKAWKHTKLNIKGEMSLASLEGMDSDDTIVLVDGDRVYDLVREGNITIREKRVFWSKVVFQLKVGKSIIFNFPLKKINFRSKTYKSPTHNKLIGLCNSGRRETFKIPQILFWN